MGRRCDNCLNFLPPILALTLIFLVYGVFMFNTVIPHPNNEAPFGKNHIGYTIGVLVTFHFLFIMVLSSFYKSSKTDPGKIPADMMWLKGEFFIDPKEELKVKDMIMNVNYKGIDKEREFIRDLPVIERKLKNGNVRYCQTCDMYKPDRTHHCRVCNSCILRMDHHCPWIFNCVGFHNYKFFALLIFYVILSILFFMGSLCHKFINSFHPVIDVEFFFIYGFPILFLYFILFFLLIALLIFFSFHLKLIFNAMTTIESREKMNSGDVHVQHRFKVAHMKWDNGKYKNFLHIFGSNPLIWFLPIEADWKATLTNGTYSETARVIQKQKNKQYD